MQYVAFVGLLNAWIISMCKYAIVNFLIHWILSRCFSTLIRIFMVIHNGVFPNRFYKFNIYLSDPWYFLSHSCLYNRTHVCKACDISPFCSTDHTSVAICLWLSDEWHNLLLTRYCIISTHQEHVAIVLSSVCEVPFDTRGNVVS